MPAPTGAGHPLPTCSSLPCLPTLTEHIAIVWQHRGWLQGGSSSERDRSLPGSFPGLRSGTKLQCSASASGAPQMKPRASNPAKRPSRVRALQGSCNQHITGATGAQRLARCSE